METETETTTSELLGEMGKTNWQPGKPRRTTAEIDNRYQRAKEYVASGKTIKDACSLAEITTMMFYGRRTEERRKKQLQKKFVKSIVSTAINNSTTTNNSPALNAPKEVVFTDTPKQGKLFVVFGDIETVTEFVNKYKN